MKSTWQHLSLAIERMGREGSERDVVFFSMLKEFADDGVIKFAIAGAIATQTPAETIQELRRTWPVDPQEDDLDGYGLWFFECPIDLVWVTIDGTEAWT